MKFSEAMAALERGEKVYNEHCAKGGYFYKDKNGDFMQSWDKTVAWFSNGVQNYNWRIYTEPKPKKKITMRFWVYENNTENYSGNWFSYTPTDYGWFPTDQTKEVEFDDEN